MACCFTKSCQKVEIDFDFEADYKRYKKTLKEILKLTKEEKKYTTDLKKRLNKAISESNKPGVSEYRNIIDELIITPVSRALVLRRPGIQYNYKDTQAPPSMILRFKSGSYVFISYNVDLRRNKKYYIVSNIEPNVSVADRTTRFPMIGEAQMRIAYYAWKVYSEMLVLDLNYNLYNMMTMLIRTEDNIDTYIKMLADGKEEEYLYRPYESFPTGWKDEKNCL